MLNAYALTFGGLLLVAGRASDLFGRKRMFRAGLTVFTLASPLDGLATSETTLIAARALQGVGAAITAPVALSLLATTFPAGPPAPRQLAHTARSPGSVVGLLLGGALTEYLNWRWVLLVNIPIAIAVLSGTGVLVEGDRERGRVDLPGAITAIAGVGSLVFAISWANTHAWTAGIGIGIVFVTIATATTHGQAPGIPSADALTHGYTTGLLVGGALYLAALIVAVLTISAGGTTSGAGRTGRR